MTSLSALIEAAKVVEYDKEVPEKRRRHNNSNKQHKETIESEKNKNSGTNSRVTHNILEKNRRAELKNFFQKLKEAVPKLQDRPKAPNVSILTEAMKYIQELNDVDKQNTKEVTRLRRCRMCLEERIKMLKEEIDRQSIQKQLYSEVGVEKKATPSLTPAKEMVSIEVQANEQDILDAIPALYRGESKIGIMSQNSCESEVKVKNKRPEQLKLSNERTIKNEPSPCSPLNTPVTDSPFLLKHSPPLSISSSTDSLLNSRRNNVVRKRSRHLNCSKDEESDSESELKIVLEDIS